MLQHGHCLRQLPAAVWRQSRDRTVPSYHPLSSAEDIPAAADRLWRGCAGLQRGTVTEVFVVDTQAQGTVTFLQVKRPMYL